MEIPVEYCGIYESDSDIKSKKLLDDRTIYIFTVQIRTHIGLSNVALGPFFHRKLKDSRLSSLLKERELNGNEISKILITVCIVSKVNHRLMKKIFDDWKYSNFWALKESTIKKENQ